MFSASDLRISDSPEPFTFDEVIARGPPLRLSVRPAIQPCVVGFRVFSNHGIMDSSRELVSPVNRMPGIRPVGAHARLYRRNRLHVVDRLPCLFPFHIGNQRKIETAIREILVLKRLAANEQFSGYISSYRISQFPDINRAVPVREAHQLPQPCLQRVWVTQVPLNSAVKLRHADTLSERAEGLAILASVGGQEPVSACTRSAD
jgi:hypothetical protein